VRAVISLGTRSSWPVIAEGVEPKVSVRSSFTRAVGRSRVSHRPAALYRDLWVGDLRPEAGGRGNCGALGRVEIGGLTNCLPRFRLATTHGSTPSNSALLRIASSRHISTLARGHVALADLLRRRKNPPDWDVHGEGKSVDPSTRRWPAQADTAHLPEMLRRDSASSSDARRRSASRDGRASIGLSLQSRDPADPAVSAGSRVFLTIYRGRLNVVRSSGWLKRASGSISAGHCASTSGHHPSLSRIYIVEAGPLLRERSRTIGFYILYVPGAQMARLTGAPLSVTECHGDWPRTPTAIRVNAVNLSGVFSRRQTLSIFIEPPAARR